MFGSEPHITTLCLSCVVQFSRRRGGLSPPRALGTSRLVELPGKGRGQGRVVSEKRLGTGNSSRSHVSADGLTPELEADASKRNLVHSKSHRVYPCFRPGGQNGNLWIKRFACESLIIFWNFPRKRRVNWATLWWIICSIIKHDWRRFRS